MFLEPRLTFLGARERRHEQLRLQGVGHGQMGCAAIPPAGCPLPFGILHTQWSGLQENDRAARATRGRGRALGPRALTLPYDHSTGEKNVLEYKPCLEQAVGRS